MPDEASPYETIIRNRSASGGVNTFSSPLDIDVTQVVDLTNGLASVPGIREVRPGSSVVATGVTHGPILAISEFTPSTFVSELLVVTPGATFPNAANLKLWKWDGTGSQFTLVGTLSGFTSATLPVDIVPGLDISGAGGPAVVRITSQQALGYDWYYAGSAISASTGSSGRPSTGMFPIGTAVGRGFGAGRDGTDRGRAFYSDVASWAGATGWNSNQSFTMGGGTRQEIVAIKDFRQSDVIIFQTDRIEAIRLNGDPLANLTGSLSTAGLWSRVVIDRTIGCGARRTVQTVGSDLLFLDQHGHVRSLAQTINDTNQGTKSEPVSKNIQSWIDRVNGAAIATAQAVSFDRYYVLSLPIDDAVTPSHTFVFDVIRGAWDGPWDGPWAKVGSMTVATLVGATASSDKNPTLYIGGAETLSGKVYRAFVGTGDDGSPIVLQETTRRESYGTLDAKKVPRRLRVYSLPAAGATMMVECRKDGGDWKFVSYADLSGSSPQLPLTGPINLTGSGIVERVFTLERNFENARDLQFRFTVTAGVEVNILGYTSQVHMKNVDWNVTQ